MKAIAKNTQTVAGANLDFETAAKMFKTEKAAHTAAKKFYESLANKEGYDFSLSYCDEAEAKEFASKAPDHFVFALFVYNMNEAWLVEQNCEPE